MVVNSMNFLIFFLVVFIVYYLLLSGKAKSQNTWLLLASYFFYGFAEWKMIPLLLTSTLAFYAIGIAIGKYNEKDGKKASVLTIIGTLLGVGILLYFKYLNFFIESFSSFFNAMGLHTNFPTFNIMMPLGISFFTFKLISYVIEVHRKHIEPCSDFVSFATYIAFFPTILSGPIDRPKPFLTQLNVGRTFNYSLAVDGCRQILWGMFKKMVVADTMAEVVDSVWSNYTVFSGSTLLLIALFYAFQMYADFSGYSDMAIGVGKILGLRIAINFKYPFFALNIADYWRRWHISLTSWLTDYIFIPLNIRFRNWGKFGLILAIIINLVVVGMWHGANWTFLLFGLYHGFLFIPLIINNSFGRRNKLKTTSCGIPCFKQFLQMLTTFLFVTIGLIIFRAESISQAFDYMSHICSLTFFSVPKVIGYVNVSALLSIIYIVIVLLLEWYNRDREYGIAFKSDCRFQSQILVYFFLIFLIYYFGASASSFIYFQF